MTRYSIECRDDMFVKDYEFLSFAKFIGKYLSGKYSQNFLDHAKQSVTDALKTTSKWVIQKATETW